MKFLSKELPVPGKFLSYRFLLLLLVCFGIFGMQWYAEKNTIFFSNLFLGDGVSLSDALRDVVQGRVSIFDVGPSKLLFLIYYFPYFFAGNCGVFILNIFITIIFFTRFDSTLLFKFPFLLLSLSLPSKDFLVFILTFEWAFFLFRKFYFRALLMLLLMYFVRDGAFFVELLCSLVILVASLHLQYWRFFVFIIFVLSWLIFLNSLDLLSIFSVFNRSLQAFHTSSRLSCCSVVDFSIRILGNATNLALRQVFFDVNGGISLLAVSFFVSGIFVMQALVLALKIILTKNSLWIAIFGTITLLTSLAIISINPLVQPRYLIPYAGVFLFMTDSVYSRSEKLKALGVAFLLVGMGCFFYHFCTNFMPPIPIVSQVHLI